ncbi:MAG: hypothetical protein ACRD0P_03100 [Stackebrandtia sp.]
MTLPSGFEPGATPGQPPPSHLTGFTVDSGFSVIPPKRPGTVTAASWILLGIATLTLLGAIGLIIAPMIDVNRDDTGIELLSGLLRPVLLFALALGLTLAALGSRRGRDGARITGYVIAGAVAVFGAMLLFSGLTVGLVNPSAGGTDVIGLLLAVLAVALPVAGIILLAAKDSDTWFHEQRGEKYINPQTPDDSKPRGPLAAALLLGGIVLFEVGNVVIRFIDIAGATSTTPTSALGYLGMLSGPSVIVLIATATAVLIPAGKDAARIIALGLCGYLIAGLAATLLALVMLFGGSESGLYLGTIIDKPSTPFQAVLAAVVIVNLARGPVAGWFHDRRNHHRAAQ